jgi:glutamate carboxypeptidase
MARFIDRIHSLTDYAREITTNVGTVSGGRMTNVVPDQTEAKFELRYVDPRDLAPIGRAIEEAAAQACAAVPGTSLELTMFGETGPLVRTAASAALAAEYSAFSAAAGLGGGEAPLVGGGSDASVPSALGIPTIDGLGPRGSGFHTLDECVERATLVPKAIAMAQLLASRVGS